ncbi:pentapeptide repeat-containing protein [bacterium]|nr:pentapeptide repeat-containing protein [bacterium]
MPNYYGVQNFKSSKDGQDKKSVYEFSAQKDFDIWMQSDMTQYVPGGVDKQYSRQKISEKEALKAKEAGTQFTKFAPYKPFDNSGAYLHIKHPDPKHADNFGIVVRFDDKKQLSEFMGRNKDYYGENAKELKNTDRRVVSGNVNGAVLKFSNDKQFDSTVKMACKSYPQLDPSRNHLAMISQRDTHKAPEVYSFDTKSYRDYFVSKINSKKDLPIVAGKLANFHPIAIDHATKGKILSGNLSEHFAHKDQYLSLNNSSHHSLSSVASKEVISQKDFSDAIKAGQKDFTSKDLRGIDLSGHSLKGLDFSNSSFAGQNLDGLDFSKITAHGADFSKCTLNGTRFDGALLQAASFKNTNGNKVPVSFKGADLSTADMKYMNMPEADLADTKMVRTNFYKSNLPGSSLLGAKTDGAEFNSVNLANSKLDSNLANHAGASFQGAYLKGTALENSPLNKPQPAQQAARAM